MKIAHVAAFESTSIDANMFLSFRRNPTRSWCWESLKVRAIIPPTYIAEQLFSHKRTLLGSRGQHPAIDDEDTSGHKCTVTTVSIAASLHSKCGISYASSLARNSAASATSSGRPMAFQGARLAIASSPSLVAHCGAVIGVAVAPGARQFTWIRSWA